MITPLPAGAPAPAFKLKATPDQYVQLSDFKNQKLILVFYPADFSPICSDELGLFNELLPEFKKHNAELLGISCDGIWSHVAFKENRKFHISLLSDFHPHGKISKAYGVYKSREGVSARAIILIDEQSVIRWTYVAPEGINPGADELLDALENLSSVKK